MTELKREETHVERFTARLSEAYLVQLIGQHVAAEAQVNLAWPGVQCRVQLFEAGARGAGEVQMVADVEIVLDRLAMTQAAVRAEEVEHV